VSEFAFSLTGNPIVDIAGAVLSLIFCIKIGRTLLRKLGVDL